VVALDGGVAGEGLLRVFREEQDRPEQPRRRRALVEPKHLARRERDGRVAGSEVQAADEHRTPVPCSGRLSASVTELALRVAALRTLGLTRTVRDDALVSRVLLRRSEGVSDERILEELRRDGYDTADIAAAFVEQRPRQEPMLRLRPLPHTARDVAVGVILLVAGLALATTRNTLVAGLGLVGLAFGKLRRSLEAPLLTREQQTAGHDGMRPLRAEDPAARCASHTTYRSLGACPRCGVFVCGACVGVDGLSATHPCLTCRTRPEFVSKRIDRLRRGVCACLVLGPIALLALLQVILANGPVPGDVAWLKSGAALLCVPWLLLSILQWVVRSFWPGLVSAGIWLATCLVFVSDFRGAHLLVLNWSVALWPAIMAYRARSAVGEPPVPLVRLAA
jgi:hypothetical protein